jgi:hypothetical protein
MAYADFVWKDWALLAQLKPSLTGDQAILALKVWGEVNHP